MTKIIVLFLAILMLCGLSAADAETEKEIPDVLGMTEGTSGELLLTENDPPFVGAGCLFANRYKGTVTWEGYWIYKIQFAHQGVSGETRRDRTTWQHDTINGDGVAVKLASDGDVCFLAHKSGMTESAAVAWLKGHAGISG